jgi:hypothetical protein
VNAGANDPRMRFFIVVNLLAVVVGVALGVALFTIVTR